MLFNDINQLDCILFLLSLLMTKYDTWITISKIPSFHFISISIWQHNKIQFYSNHIIITMISEIVKLIFSLFNFSSMPGFMYLFNQLWLVWWTGITNSTTLANKIQYLRACTAHGNVLSMLFPWSTVNPR